MKKHIFKKISVRFNKLNDNYCSRNCEALQATPSHVRIGDVDKNYCTCYAFKTDNGYYESCKADFENMHISGIYEYFYYRCKKCKEKWAPKNKIIKIPKRWSEKERLDYIEYVKK